MGAWGLGVFDNEEAGDFLSEVEEGDESIAPYADVLIRLPKVPTLLQPVVAVVPLQDPAVTLRAFTAVRRGRGQWAPLALVLEMLQR